MVLMVFTTWYSLAIYNVNIQKLTAINYPIGSALIIECTTPFLLYLLYTFNNETDIAARYCKIHVGYSNAIIVICGPVCIKEFIAF